MFDELVISIQYLVRSAIQLNILVEPTIVDMAFTCKDCGQKFLSSSEYKRHQQIHLQTHIDRWSKPDKVTWKPSEGMNQDLFKIFGKYRLGEAAMLCLWVNGQLNTAIVNHPVFSNYRFLV
jgi:hypothetical protein